MENFFDTLERRTPEQRERAQFAALSGLLATVKESVPYLAETLAGVDPNTIINREALASLPVTRKAKLIDMQRSSPPFGGMTPPDASFKRVFASPGPIYEPQGQSADFWRMGRALFAAGVRAGHLVHNAFSYHLTPAGAMLESAAHALGCTVVPAGVGQTELQARTVADLRPDVYVGTPSFLKILVEKAAELELDITCLTRALVAGEALPPSLRAELESAGITTRQCYGTADLGLIAYESDALEGLILDEGVLVEIVRPGTGEPVTAEEVGEVVVTTLNPDYPLVRFATGDLSAVLPGVSPCGRTNTRIKGWMGRADQTTKVRGMFVHPEQVAQVVQRHPEVQRARLVVSSENNQDSMTLHCEVAQSDDAQLSQAIANTAREICKLRADVVLDSPGTLANDGRVIDDARTYE